MAVKLETNLTASLLKKHAFKKTYFKGCSPKNTFVPPKSAAAFSGLFQLKHAKNDVEMGSFVWRAGRYHMRLARVQKLILLQLMLER
jgi:hypothetical protein